MEFIQAKENDGVELAEIRAIAMKPSLEALGRYNEVRVRNRFLDNFKPACTFKVILYGDLAGFYVLIDKVDYFYLDHLYIRPEFQNKGLGTQVLEALKIQSQLKQVPLKLGALRGNDSNKFYLNNGFQITHEDEFDIYYQFGFVS